MESPPLDPRVLANVVRSYEGETLQVPECDVPVYHGKGRVEFKTGFSYTGDFVCGRMHGTGRIEWHNSGVVYEGDFTHSEITGRGTYWWPNGGSYVGEVKCGKRHGRGVFITGGRGVVLEGSKASREEGEPELPNPLLFAFRPTEDATVGYSGSGDNDECSQSEVVVAQSNARYDGEWQNGLPHGYGELVFDAARNIRYEGHFVAGKRQGRGHMHYEDGSVFAGEWKDDVKCGQGVMAWMTETTNPEDVTPIERYDGEWENDYQHGFGRHVWLVSASSSAPTDSSKSTSSGPSQDKNWYEGEFHQGLRHGRGVFFYANGARYEGEWKNNVKDGYGLFFYEDGRVFVGLFRQDRSVEGCYATAATTSASIAPITTALPPLSPTNVESPAPPLSPTQPPPSSSVGGIMLFINDLLSIPDAVKCEKARKAVEHAALRINTELRALYRGCIRDSRRSSNSAAVDSDTAGDLLEVFECRRLLCQCGFYFTSGQLDNFVRDVRRGQRASALACATSMNIGEHFMTDRLVERKPVDPIRLEVVPSDQLLLYREFVELLVRVAHSWVSNAEVAGVVDLSASHDSTSFLADIFSDMYEQMVRERQEALAQRSPSWITSLRAELMGKSLHNVFTKYHDRLRSLYKSCEAPSVRRQDEDVDNYGEEEPREPASKQSPSVTIRSVVVMMRYSAASDIPIFSTRFQICDALTALSRAFTTSSSPLKGKLLTGEGNPDDDAELDPFFMGVELVYSEFLDAIAIVLFAKQQKELDGCAQLSVKQQKQMQELPLHVLTDRFIQSVKVEG